MSDFDNVVPDWNDVPEDDAAEPDNLTVEHVATPEEVDEASEPEPESGDDDEFIPVDRAGDPLDDEDENEDEA